MKAVLAVILVLVTAPIVMAETPGSFLDQDGPWIEIPDGYVVNTSPPTTADIVAMADLDGDMTVTTDDEARMIELLTQVLTGMPVSK